MGINISLGLGRHLLPSHNALSSPSGLKQTYPYLHSLCEAAKQSRLVCAQC